MSGWIKLHRRLKEWQWYDDDNCLRLLIHLLISVNYEPKKWHGIIIKPGQMVFTWPTLSSDTKMSEKQLRIAMKKLEEGREVERERAGRYQLVTLIKWDQLQGSDDEKGRMGADKRAGLGQEKDRQTAGTKEGNNIKNEETTTLFPEMEDLPSRIIRYLNKVKPSKRPFELTASNLSHVKARIREKKYTFEDFKRVIDAKVADWSKSVKMKKYIRPKTLFGDKFDQYVVETAEPKRVTDGSNNFEYKPSDKPNFS